MIARTVTTEITTSNPNEGPRLRLEPGWMARIPEITPDPSDPLFRQFVEYELRDRRYRGQAKAAAAETLRNFWVRSWLSGLKEAMRHYMTKYAKRHPQTVAKDGTLQGFDPEEVAGWWYPGENVGRAGKSFVKREFMRMVEGVGNDADD